MEICYLFVKKCICIIRICIFKELYPNLMRFLQFSNQIVKPMHILDMLDCTECINTQSHPVYGRSFWSLVLKWFPRSLHSNKSFNKLYEVTVYSLLSDRVTITIQGNTKMIQYQQTFCLLHYAICPRFVYAINMFNKFKDFYNLSMSCLLLWVLSIVLDLEYEYSYHSALFHGDIIMSYNPF